MWCFNVYIFEPDSFCPLWYYYRFCFVWQVCMGKQLLNIDNFNLHIPRCVFFPLTSRLDSKYGFIYAFAAIVNTRARSKCSRHRCERINKALTIPSAVAAQQEIITFPAPLTVFRTRIEIFAKNLPYGNLFSAAARTNSILIGTFQVRFATKLSATWQTLA